MRVRFAPRHLAILCLFTGLWGLTVSISAADAEQTHDVSEVTSAEEALKTGEQLETNRQWVEAIQFYQDSLKRWENDESLTYALRRTRIHFGIDRRYIDQSFSARLLQLGRAEALDLFEDILTRVQFEYVDNVSVTKFVSHGTESLYMALGNSRFVKQNLPQADAGKIENVRRTLVREFWNQRVDTRIEARSLITQICELCQREVGLNSSAIVLEYIFGGCNALDEYSIMLTPDRYNDLFGSIQGELVGIGIEMKGEKGRGMHLVRVLMDSPAEAGGLLPDDYIVRIDGVDCRDLSTDDAARLLRGNSGSTVRLHWETPTGEIRDADFTRRRVQIHSITKAELLDEQEGIGYIRMEGFQSSTTDELDEALRRLERRGMRALVWDLRGNPGGLLETAAAVLDRFVSDGVLVSTKGRSPDQNQVFRAHGYNTRNYPLVLIVDEDSASASEIVAGAIHDHHRGTIVGRKTYGKWSVQSIIHLPGETGLKLTTARFYSPDDQNYAGKGLRPDIEVPRPKDQRTAGFRGESLLTDPDIDQAFEILRTRLSKSTP
ncbi:MAG: S41 family peptidase [Planctomycetaceae bacterium]|nr:S41 family peptidase [Planctomycetaceae bacterium]